MPRDYGTALYGTGNYSALTASTVTATQGSIALAGETATLFWQCRFGLTFGSLTLSGFGMLSKVAQTVPTGLVALSGKDVAFGGGNLWSPVAPGSESWAPQMTASNPWTPAVPGCATWTPNP
jgi:hypothetical protein